MDQGTEAGPNRAGDPIDQVRTILRRSAAMGFLGGMSIEDQVVHALGFRAAVEHVLGRSPTSVVDLGTGGGLPGLVLAAVWPTTRVVLLDSSERRTDFLHQEVEQWGRADRVSVTRGRAEEVGRSAGLAAGTEVVVARSFGSPAVTAECSAPLLELGGLLTVSEPPEADSSDRWPEAGLAMVGLESLASFRYLDRFGYQLLKKISLTPDRYPRRVGIPTKRPLF
jgi:16S rRNA (guanine527-N7)-methyltransferase